MFQQILCYWPKYKEKAKVKKIPFFSFVKPNIFNCAVFSNFQIVLGVTGFKWKRN